MSDFLIFFFFGSGGYLGFLIYRDLSQLPIHKISAQKFLNCLSDSHLKLRVAPILNLKIKTILCAPLKNTYANPSQKSLTQVLTLYVYDRAMSPMIF